MGNEGLGKFRKSFKIICDNGLLNTDDQFQCEKAIAVLNELNLIVHAWKIEDTNQNQTKTYLKYFVTNESLTDEINRHRTADEQKEFDKLIEDIITLKDEIIKPIKSLFNEVLSRGSIYTGYFANTLQEQGIISFYLIQQSFYEIIDFSTNEMQKQLSLPCQLLLLEKLKGLGFFNEKYEISEYSGVKCTTHSGI